MIIERQSIADAPAAQVWARVVTPKAINDELRPWMTMSMPRGAESLTVDNVPIGVSIGRAWLRLFGVLPFDYDQLTHRRTSAGTRLPCGTDDAEHAAMAARAPRDTGRRHKTLVRDRITFQLRAPLRPLTPVIAAAVRALFGHRHRRLQRHFACRVHRSHM